MDKKEEIIQSAIRFFSEKGYFSTSMQEIAEDCGISKGTLYNFFDSKEELLIQVIDQSCKRILQNTMNIDFNTSLSPKEKLVKKIVMQFDAVFENKNSITMLLRTFIPQSNPQIAWLVNKIRVTTMNWYKDCLLEAFGSKVEPYIWDFTLILQGAVKEYACLAIKEDKNIDFQAAVRFVVDRLEMMIHHTENAKPIVTSNEMAEYETFENDADLASPKEQIKNQLEEMENKLKQLSMSKQDRQESISVIHYLRQELDEQEPRKFMIKSLLLYLSEIKECKPFVQLIETILKAAYP